MITFEKTNPIEIDYLGERINYSFFFLNKENDRNVCFVMSS